MKSELLVISRCRLAACGLLMGLVLLSSGSVDAQNLVRNPDFEEPLGPDNWTIEYVLGGPNDFFIKGRTRLAHKNMAAPGSDTWDGHPTYWNKLGLDIKAGNDGLIRAYVKQVISGLKPGFQYAASAWMTQYEGPVDKVLVYMEVLGGPSGTISKRTPYVTTVSKNNPAGWTRYVITNTASTSGQMEIRLHYDKNGYTTDKWRTMDALYDHVSLMLVGQPDYTPPYRILSFARANEDVTLQWQTVMNSRYRIQVSTNVSESMSWSWLQRSPYLDTNFAAPGTNFTFTTNLVNLFSYDPAFDVSAPLYFRIYSEPFKP